MDPEYIDMFDGFNEWASDKARNNRPRAPAAEPLSAGKQLRRDMLSAILRNQDVDAGKAPRPPLQAAESQYGPFEDPYEYPPTMAGRAQPPRQKPDPSGLEAPDVGVAGRGWPDPADLYARQAEMDRTPVDTSGLEQLGRNRNESGRSDIMAGLIMQTLGGKRIAPTGRAITELGLENSTMFRPNAADEGYVDPLTGKYVDNVLARRRHEQKDVGDRLQDLNTVMGQAEGREITSQAYKDANARAEARNQLQRDHYAALEKFKRDDLAARQKMAEARAKAIAAGKAPGGGGKPTAQAEKRKYADDDQIQHALRLDRLMKSVEENPEAFGHIGRLAGLLPGPLEGFALDKWMSNENRGVRNAVVQESSVLIKNFAGSAATPSEMKRIERWAPAPTDSPQVVIQKLQTQIELINEMRRAKGMSTTPPRAPSAPVVRPEVQLPAGQQPAAPWNIDGKVRMKGK